MSNRLNRSLVWPALAALLAFHAGSAAAQLYKWVDERGRVTYSNQLPVDSKSAQKATVVADRVSVYSPDAALLRAVETNRQRTVQAALEKPAAWQPAVASIGAPAPALSPSPETDLADYPIFWGGGGGYWGHRPPPPLHKVPQIKLRPGAIAGNMVENGLIAGNTVPLFPPPPPASKPGRDDPRPAPHGGYGWRR